MQTGAEQSKHGHIRVLLAEDCPDSQALLLHIFEKAGVQVTCACNGVEAVEKTLGALNDNNPFDMVLLDVQMPKLDGHSTARQLRKKGYSLPIVAMTARSTPTDMAESLGAGCNGHISKLAGPKLLIAEVERHLAKKPPRTELPPLPAVPTLLKQNPGYVDFVLDYIEKLPTRMDVLGSAIDASEFQIVSEITYELGILSLYGYTLFASHLNEIQVASDNSDQLELQRIFPQLLHASKCIVAGKDALKKLLKSEV